MAASDDATTSATARLVAEVADRAEGRDGDVDPTPVAEPDAVHVALAEVREHLAAAWHSSEAGAEVPDSARLASVRRAVVAGLRDGTTHQVTSTRSLAIAVDRLARAVEGLITRTDELKAGLEDQHRRAEDRAGPVNAALARLRAGVATLDVGQADLEVDHAHLLARVDELALLVADAEADLARQRQRVAAATATQDVVRRAARRAMSSSSSSTATTTAATTVDDAASPLGGLADEAHLAEVTLLRRLAAVGRPAPDVVRDWARAVSDAVGHAAAAGPVLDLSCDAGEWLDVWAELGLEATGVDDVVERVAAARDRGLAVVAADPLGHLAERQAGSLGAVTAAVLADVVPLASLVELVAMARSGLGPGGVLVLAAADPRGATGGDTQWRDPRRRPVHPELVVALALESGFAEADVVVLPGDVAAYAVVARTAGEAPDAP